MTSLCCWPCSSGNISYSLQIPQGAYASGQTLRYTLTIQNQSMTDISGFRVDFHEHISFTANSPELKTRKTDVIVATQKHESDSDVCLKLSNRKFEGSLVLPPLPPDTEEREKIIRVKHSMTVELNYRGCHCDDTIKIPILIGTIPIRESPERSNTYRPKAPSAPLLEDGEKGDLPPDYEGLCEYLSILFQF